MDYSTKQYANGNHGNKLNGLLSVDMGRGPNLHETMTEGGGGTVGTWISFEMGDSSMTRRNFASNWTCISIRVSLLLVALLQFFFFQI